MSALFRLAAILILSASALVPVRAWAQTGRARVSPTTVAVGERVAYTVTIGGGGSSPVSAPPVSGGLRPVQQLPTSDVTTQINGSIQRETTWTYVATAPGEARIGPARVPIGGNRVLQVDVVTVRVTAPSPQPSRAPPGGTAPAPGERSDLFARLELSRERAVLGQQIVADVVLYFDPDLQLRQTAITQSWDAPGFWREEMDVASTVPRPVTLGGRAYEAVTVRRVALFPTRAGRLELPPMEFAVDLLRVDPDPYDPFGGFFNPFSARFEERDVQTPATSIDVRALPAGAPASFSGAVGQFAMAAQPTPSSVAAGDPVLLDIAISGAGNIATLAAPTLDAPAGLDAFRPRDAADIDRAGREVWGTKTFTFTLVPQGGGRFAVPPAEWSYFDPETDTYRTLQTDTLRLDVSGAPAAQSGPEREQVDGTIAPLLTEAHWSRRGLPVGVLWGILGVGLGAPLLALGGVALVRRRRRLATVDTPQARRRLALSRASARLDASGTLDGPEAYAEAERTVHAFLWDRFGITATGLTRRDLAHALDTHRVPHAPRLLALTDALGAGQFAPGMAPLSPAQALGEARATLAAATDDAPPPERRTRTRGVAAALVLLIAGPGHAQPAGAQTPDDLFALGTRLVAEGDTVGAIAAFEGASHAADGRASAAVEHNLGTLALARGDAGRARLHTARAERLTPLDAGIVQNATLARAMAKAPTEARTDRIWTILLGVAGPTGLVALALALTYAALGLVLAEKRRAAVPVGVLALVAVFAALGALSAASLTEGVVLAATDVRASAAPDGDRTGALAPGAVVRVGDAAGAWRHVETDDAEGWVPVSAVEAL